MDKVTIIPSSLRAELTTKEKVFVFGFISSTILAACGPANPAEAPEAEAPVVPDDEIPADVQNPTIEATLVPNPEDVESVFRGELISLERGNEVAGELESKFTQEFGRRGEGLIFRNSEIIGNGVGPDVQLIFTPVVSNEDGSQHTKTDIYQLVGETWTKLDIVTPEIIDLTGDSLVDWQTYLQESDIITSGKLDINNLKSMRLARVSAINGGHILAERVFIFETADGPKAIREFFVRDEDGKFHPVELTNSDFDYEIAAVDITTDGGPVFLLRNNNSENGVKVVIVPAELFNSIKDKNPVMSVDGNQILNGDNTSEVLLENRGGVWTLVATVESTAEEETGSDLYSEYDLPQFVLDGIEGKDVSFDEEVSPYVEGVLITSETGEHLFYFNAEEGGGWVETNAFEGTDNIFTITSTITEEQLKSQKLMDWLYYKASQLEFDLEKINHAEMMYISGAGIEKIGFMPGSFVSEGSAFFEKNSGVLMMIDTPTTDFLSDHVFAPVILLGTDDNGKLKLYPIKGFIQ